MMKTTTMKIQLLSYFSVIVIFLQFVSPTEGFSCYECNSNATHCPEFMEDDDMKIVPLNKCSYVYEGAYCVKTTGITGGSLGTRRFCSSRDMGNYCEYIKRPGDIHEYRSCVYTCSSDGCNPAQVVRPPHILYHGSAFLLTFLVIYCYLR